MDSVPPMKTLPDPTDAPTRRRCVEAAHARSVLPEVLEHLVARTEAQRQTWQDLAEGVAVVTGQQTGLFGGPLYTLHKAAAAIVDARALTEETGIPAAPLFWLQEEDHDFDEIASSTVLGADGCPVQVTVEGLPEQAGWPVAFRRLGPSVLTALDQVEAALDGLPHTAEVMGLLRASYTPDSTCSDAFRTVLERLFAPYGLLIVDPMSPALRDAASPVHAHAFAAAGPLSEALSAQGEALAAAGRPVPVYVRPDAPLSFVHPDGLEGPRFRVEPEGDGYRLCGAERVVSHAEMEGWPRTTSALLRPLLQDSWLPTAAYVGGPGELAYLAQLPPGWEGFDLPVPLVVPRARFVLVETAIQRTLDALELTVADLELGRDALLTRLGRAGAGRPDPDTLFAGITEASRQALEDFRPIAAELELGLGKSVDKTLGHLQKNAERLMDRYRKALARDDALTMERLDRVLNALRPGGAPQERVYGFASFAARVGIDELVHLVLTAVEPFDGSLREVAL